jgi:esterase/lipase
MVSNLSTPLNDPMIDYPLSDSSLPFAKYIARCRTMIEERRPDLQKSSPPAELIIQANCPFELYPNHPVRSGNRLKYGVLLIHGLLDSPFSLRDIGTCLQNNGILSRAILLPGHGTVPSDLLKVSYHDWIKAVRYGVESLRKEVEQIILMGYSTGAALSIYQALQDSQIASVVLISPAIKIKTPIDIVVGWHYLMKWFSNNNKQWLYCEDEIDYAKYQSIAFNPVNQVSRLTEVISELRKHHSITRPVFMVVSREDETISSHKAIDFFSHLHNQESNMLLYTSIDHRYPDPRILSRQSQHPDLNINHFSHTAIPFSPHNPHYGQHGDYIHAAHSNVNNVVYGAYNHLEETSSALFYHLGLLSSRRRELTYNPDYDFMTDRMIKFILTS